MNTADSTMTPIVRRINTARSARRCASRASSRRRRSPRSAMAHGHNWRMTNSATAVAPPMAGGIIPAANN